MKVVITGAEGFLGWHTACRLRSTRGIEPVRLGRSKYSRAGLGDAIAAADAVLHLAGVNRAESGEKVEQGNVDLANVLGQAIRECGRPVHLVYGNSVQAEQDNPYGRGKAAAAQILNDALDEVKGSMTDCLLPNVFGEHGRPAYNSFVATFCHEIAQGRSPSVVDDREVPLIHAQRAAEVLIRAAESRVVGRVAPAGEPRRVSDVLQQLQTFKGLYGRGEIPDLTDAFSVDLFNTYRSYTFPNDFPMAPAVHADDRGRLFETVRTHGGTGQAFVSTTVPGATRGEHYHLSKIERFFVVQGEAEIALRRLYHDEVVRFRLSGDRPAFVDMPTMWVHNITNVGESDLVTMFWADQLLDPQNPDQYPETVNRAQEASA